MEKDPRETRVALIPSGAQKLSAAGWEVNVESGAGVKSGFSDADYQAAGAKIVGREAVKEADFVVLAANLAEKKTGIGNLPQPAIKNDRKETLCSFLFLSFTKKIPSICILSPL